MPFITQEDRERIDKNPWTAGKPGELCYVFYKEMVEKWRSNPRWTTAHEIYREMCEDHANSFDEGAAKELAWQVFFIKYVMPYEDEKEKLNGTI
jgi:hypothetical protein